MSLTLCFFSYFPNISDSELAALANAYPDDVTQVTEPISKAIKYLLLFCFLGISLQYWDGQRFNVCISCVSYESPIPVTVIRFRPQYKRFAAFHGDMSFQAPRRFLLEIASKTQPTYSYRELIMLLFYPPKLLTLQSGYMRVGLEPALGASYGFDILEFFGLGNQTDFIAVDSISKYAGSDSESGRAKTVASLFCPKTQPKCTKRFDQPSQEHHLGEMVVM